MSIASGTGSTVAQAPPASASPPVTPEDGPVAIAFSPPADAIDVNTSTNLIAQFDKAVKLGAGNVTLKQTSDGVMVEAWDVVGDAGTGAGQVNVFSATQLTLRLSAPVAGGTKYYVIWDQGVVIDVNDNPVAAQTSTTAWSFTTAA